MKKTCRMCGKLYEPAKNDIGSELNPTFCERCLEVTRMTYGLCGNCLHAKSSHTENHNFMYCSVCFKLCDIDEFNIKHKPTDIKTVWEIASKKQ